MLDRDIYKRGDKPGKYNGNDLVRRPFRNLFIDEKDTLIAQIIWNFFFAVQKKWPSAWNILQVEMILNKSTGFIALMKFLRILYPTFGKIGEVITKEEFIVIFKEIDISESSLNRTNYIPGSTGQSDLFTALMMCSGI